MFYILKDEIAKNKNLSKEILDQIEQQKLTISQDTDIKKNLQVCNLYNCLDSTEYYNTFL